MTQSTASTGRRKEPKGKRRALILAFTEHRCWYCGVHLEREVNLTFDHVAPKVAGGGSKTDNLVASCYTCNTKKGSMTPEGFRRIHHGNRLFYGERYSRKPLYDSLTGLVEEVTEGMRCWYCGDALQTGRLDEHPINQHIAVYSPLVFEVGSFQVISCYNCNRLRGMQSLDEFRMNDWNGQAFFGEMGEAGYDAVLSRSWLVLLIRASSCFRGCKYWGRFKGRGDSSGL